MASLCYIDRFVQDCSKSHCVSNGVVTARSHRHGDDHDDVIRWKYALLALCEGNSPVTGEFPTQRPVTRSFDVFFELCLTKRLSKQPRGWWFETPSLWRHCNDRNAFKKLFCALRLPDPIPNLLTHMVPTGPYFREKCLFWNMGVPALEKSLLLNIFDRSPGKVLIFNRCDKT